MPDDALQERLRAALAPRGVTEQKMFGGLCLMLAGNMLVCASKRGLLVRVGKDGHTAALARPHARVMEMRGRPMEGYIFVDPAGITSDKDLKSWVGLALAFVEALPPKAKAVKPAKTPAGKGTRSRK